MRTVITANSNRDEFEDVLFSPDLIVVQKEFTELYTHTQVVYVYNKHGDTIPAYGIFREISEHGTDYWKETYEA